MGLAVVIYDAPEVLKRFADERGITYPLLSDVGSPIITSYGLLNTTMKEGTRGVVEAANSAHEVFRGVGEIFATTDVYGIANLDQKTATILLRGAVTETLDPASKAVEGPKNNPLMPLAWLREYTAPNGTTKGKAFCTTLGASVDFADEDLRRLIVNTAYHLTGAKVPGKADVGYVDPFEPTFYSALKSDHHKQLNRKPDDFALGKSPATGLPAAQPKKEDKKDKSNEYGIKYLKEKLPFCKLVAVNDATGAALTVM